MVRVKVATMSGGSFEVRVSVTAPLSVLRRRAARELQVKPSHLALFIGAVELTDDDASVADSFEAAIREDPEVLNSRHAVPVAAVVSGRACTYCGSRSTRLQYCGRCHVAYYCSVDCQLLDWPQHKRACEPEEVD